MIETQLQRQRVFIINPTLLQRFWCYQRESPSVCETTKTLFEINLISWRERKVFIMSKLWSESWNVSKCWSAFRERRNGPWFSGTFSSSCLHVHCCRTDAELEIKTLKKSPNEDERGMRWWNNSGIFWPYTDFLQSNLQPLNHIFVSTRLQRRSLGSFFLTISTAGDLM